MNGIRVIKNAYRFVLITLLILIFLFLGLSFIYTLEENHATLEQVDSCDTSAQTCDVILSLDGYDAKLKATIKIYEPVDITKVQSGDRIEEVCYTPRKFLNMETRCYWYYTYAGDHHDS